MWSPEYDVGLEDSLSDEELSILRQFYERMLKCSLDVCRSKRYLIRWLRARNWDIDEAENMLCTHIKWREIHEVHTIIDRYTVPEMIQKYFPGGFCGEDKEGYPLYCAPVGRFDPGGFMKATTNTEFIQSRIYFLEYITQKIFYEKSKEHNKCIDQLTLILDMKGLSLKHMHPSWIPVFSEMMTVLEANYPEVLRICYQTYTRKDSRFKIRLPTCLTSSIDATGLPACYGGKITDPNGDPQCPSRISWGGSVHPSFFRKKLPDVKPTISKQNETPEEVKHLTDCGQALSLAEVGPASRRDIYIGAVSVTDEINWWVSCEAHDIAVCVLMKKPSTDNEEVMNDSTSSSEQLIEVVPAKRVSSNEKIVQGTLRVETAGMYVLSLDNSYSWTKSKRLWYHFSVTVKAEKSSHNCTPFTPLSIEFDNEQCKQITDTLMNDLTVLPIPKENYYACRMETGGSMDLNVSILFRFLVQIFILPRIKQRLN
ncbi:unnamed protein product [Heterobilharzia americana]|nr:unnamed protein product [Heterobilharzia americana]